MGGRLRGYLPQHWPAEAKPTLVEHSVDLAGDGSLVTVLLPGHTPGHMGLLVRSQEGGWLLAGDAAHTAEELPAVAPGVDRLCRWERVEPLLAHDAQASTRSRRSVTSSPASPRRRARTNAVLTRTP